MVPFKDNGHLTARQKLFNKRLSATRVIIEQAFGRLKTVWRRLKYLNIYNLRYVKYIVISACILHNKLIRDNTACDMDDNDRDDGDNERYDEEEPYLGNIPLMARNKRDFIMNNIN